jgi:hypothetical protein
MNINTYIGIFTPMTRKVFSREIDVAPMEDSLATLAVAMWPGGEWDRARMRRRAGGESESTHLGT